MAVSERDRERFARQVAALATVEIDEPVLGNDAALIFESVNPERIAAGLEPFGDDEHAQLIIHRRAKRLGLIKRR